MFLVHHCLRSLIMKHQQPNLGTSKMVLIFQFSRTIYYGYSKKPMYNPTIPLLYKQCEILRSARSVKQNGSKCPSKYYSGCIQHRCSCVRAVGSFFATTPSPIFRQFSGPRRTNQRSTQALQCTKRGIGITKVKIKTCVKVCEKISFYNCNFSYRNPYLSKVYGGNWFRSNFQDLFSYKGAQKLEWFEVLEGNDCSPVPATVNAGNVNNFCSCLFTVSTKFQNPLCRTASP